MSDNEVAQGRERAWAITPQRQEHPNGCGIAVMAMVADMTYTEVFNYLQTLWPQERDFVEHGTHQSLVEWFLASHSYVWRTLYRGWKIDPWPPAPFAPRHIVQVKQPSGTTHYVAMTATGDVLDPLADEPTRLDAWETVNNITGVWRHGFTPAVSVSE